jgi:pyrimidine-nucleoside phosphorylase
MRAVDIIAKKRDGQALSEAEIRWFIDGYTRDAIPDYQAAALLMAICIRGMRREEVVHLTLAMAHSGQILDLSDTLGYAVDKHSSGGVGDKTSLVVLPLVASCGVKVAKMSGRGLGLTGGTLDKLESIAGFRVDLSEAEFRRIAAEHGLVLAGQSADLAPADKKIYALRDVTATVPSLPLIVSSIMSKKIAAGAQGIVLDVKVGSGAFMETLEQGKELARAMVDIGVSAGRDMVAVISDMSQPLGSAVGHALEVREAIAVLHGGGPADLREHCLHIAALMLKLVGQRERWSDPAEVRAYLERQIDNGHALNKFREMVAAQGGDVGMVDNPDLMPRAAIVETVYAEKAGIVERMDAHQVAVTAFELGAGREQKGQTIDLAVGVEVHARAGDRVEIGSPLLTLHVNDEQRLQTARVLAQKAALIGDSPVAPPLFYDTIVEWAHQ